MGQYLKASSEPPIHFQRPGGISMGQQILLSFMIDDVHGIELSLVGHACIHGCV